MADLVICKLSHCSGSVVGGNEIILLCEKVAKGEGIIDKYDAKYVSVSKPIVFIIMFFRGYQRTILRRERWHRRVGRLRRFYSDSSSQTSCHSFSNAQIQNSGGNLAEFDLSYNRGR